VNRSLADSGLGDLGAGARRDDGAGGERRARRGGAFSHASPIRGSKRPPSTTPRTDGAENGKRKKKKTRKQPRKNPKTQERIRGGRGRNTSQRGTFSRSRGGEQLEGGIENRRKLLLTRLQSNSESGRRGATAQHSARRKGERGKEGGRKEGSEQK